MRYIAWDKVTDTAVAPERQPNDSEWHKDTKTGTKKEYHISVPPSLSGTKAVAIAKVNPEARRRIEALDWMLDRANRHTKLNKPQKKAEIDVLKLQQDIEEASDAAIIAIDELTTIEEVQAFTW